MKIRSSAPRRAARCALLLASIVFAVSAGALAADEASGKVSFKTYSTAVKYAWLVRAPDEMNPARPFYAFTCRAPTSAPRSGRVKLCLVQTARYTMGP